MLSSASIKTTMTILGFYYTYELHKIPGSRFGIVNQHA